MVIDLFGKALLHLVVELHLAALRPAAFPGRNPDLLALQRSQGCDGAGARKTVSFTVTSFFGLAG